MNSSCLLWTDNSGWQRTESFFLGRTCDRTLFTFHRVHFPSRPAKTHCTVTSSSSSWINFTLLWLVIGSQTPLIPPWLFIISSLTHSPFLVPDSRFTYRTCYNKHFKLSPVS
ncbi:hypothetical protein AMECASPLE_036207 [Ameca splendens]|uniref:Uncharacterized protein n=1 Tax=Ameca splendens TaxID=208324 RepID=A0ABV0YUV3_9TELE